jgi:hypothetical protein
VPEEAKRRSAVVLALIETWSYQNAGPIVGVAAHINAANVKNAGNLMVACQIFLAGASFPAEFQESREAFAHVRFGSN